MKHLTRRFIADCLAPFFERGASDSELSEKTGLPVYTIGKLRRLKGFPPSQGRLTPRRTAKYETIPDKPRLVRRVKLPTPRKGNNVEEDLL